MKLLLTSSSKIVHKLLPEIIGKPIEETKIAWVTTASKGVEDLSYLDEHRNTMKELGWHFEEIDIEEKSKDDLERIFLSKNVIHVDGGNTFYLLKAIRQTGFDLVIKKFLTRGGVYVGSSAGSYIACPTIEMATWKKNKKPRFGVTDFKSLHLVPFLIVAHYHPRNHELLKTEINKTNYKVKLLTDEQALLVYDETVEMVGEGEEIKLT